MAEVALSIGGRAYKLACRDGEEEDLRSAAGLLESRVASLMEAHGAVAEPRLLLMAALLVSGELLERRSSEARLTPFPAPSQPVVAPGPGLAAYEALAARAEALAVRLEEAALTA
jgi:cell division protein ZapA